MGPHDILLSDFEDEWQHIKPHILGTELPYEKICGLDKVDIIAEYLHHEIKKDPKINFFFKV